ncbi:hypothetical protein K9B37_22065 [Microvirga sp. WGZ8]|uniref:Uncharacterized protein n=2 Tax=Microvirga puerhi TaxID=2876078 RepID=A0ABS7VTP8_9HYPH|nr:hypothetical protein [Microvirga puerhi]
MVPHFGWKDATAIARLGIDYAAHQGERFREVEQEIFEAAKNGTPPKVLRLAGGARAVLDKEDIFEAACETLRRWGEADPLPFVCGDNLLRYSSNVANSILDGAHFSSSTSELQTLSGGEPVRFEPTIPTHLRMETMNRFNAAMKTVEKVFNLSSDNRFRSPVRFHFTKNGLSDFNGTFRFKTGADIPLIGQIQYSPWKPGAIVHEIGHALDFAFLPRSGKEEKYQYLLEETGIMEVVSDMVNSSHTSDSYKAYLLAPHEVFARTFEMAMIMNAREEEDDKLLSLGGALALRFEYTTTSQEMLDVFLDRTREWNRDFANRAALGQTKSAESPLQPRV